MLGGPPNIPFLPRLIDYLDHHARERPDVVAMSDAGTSLTYAQVADRTATLASGLIADGIEHGDRVAVYGDPCIDCACVLLAAGAIGAVYVGLNPKYRAGELAVVLRDAQPSLVLLLCDDEDESDANKLTSACQQAAIRCGVVSRRERDRPSWSSWTAWSSRSTWVEELWTRRHAVAPDHPVAMVYTSGSTGMPKGALLRTRGLATSYRIQAARWYDERPVMVSDLPINHLGWVGDHCAAMIVAGGTLHFLERYSTEAVLEMIEARRANYWFTITTMLLMAMRSPKWDEADLSSLRRIVWAGSGAPRATVFRLAELGVQLATCYGMTETTGNVTYTDDDAIPDVLCETVGRPATELEVRLVNADGAPCQIGEAGEIHVRGDVVFAGYFRRPDATAETIDDEGWLRTGDLAVRRADGNLALTGRNHDMFKSGGYNIYPREVELVLERHPAVAEAVVVSVAHEIWGEVGHAFVRPAAGTDLDATRLQEWSRGHLANYKVPKQITIRDELPLLSIGKIDRRALRDEARRG